MRPIKKRDQLILLEKDLVKTFRRKCDICVNFVSTSDNGKRFVAKLTF